jgi:translation elongation factor EF-Ts
MLLVAHIGAGAIRLASTKVTAENVKLLRQQTSLSIGLCRKALETANNDVAAAVKWLQDNEQTRAE